MNCLCCKFFGVASCWEVEWIRFANEYLTTEHLIQMSARRSAAKHWWAWDDSIYKQLQMGRTQIFVRLNKMTGLILEKLQIGKKQKTFFVKESEILSEFAWTDLNLGFLICVHASDIKNMRSPIDSLDWQIARAADLLLILRCAAKLIQLLAYNRSWMKWRDPISIFYHFQFRQLNLNQWKNTCVPL